jgi:hypothetical protein
MFYFEILQDYLYILEFVLARLILVLLVLMLFQILLNLPITRDFHEELQIFNSDPKNMPFVVLLRKYHFQLFLLGYINFSLATTYFVENFMVSYVLGIVAFVSVVLYLIQFVVYMQQYLKRAPKSYSYTGKEPIKRYVSGLSYWVTSKGMKQAGVMCLECVKVTVQLVFGAETL